MSCANDGCARFVYTDNRWVVTLSIALATDLPNSLDRGSVERAGRLRRNDRTAGR